MRSSHKSRHKGKHQYKLPKLLILSFIVTLSLFFVFFITYKLFTHTSYTNFKESINNEIISINEINSTTKSLKNSSNVLIVDDAKTNLISIRDNLIGIYTNIKKISPPNQWLTSYNNLLEGLDFNIKLIKEIIFIVNNPQNPNLETSLEDLNNYKSKCSKAYLLSGFKELNIFLPKEFNESIESVCIFAENNIANNKAELLLKEKLNKYITSIEDVLSSFNVIYNNHNSYEQEKKQSRMTHKKFESLLEKVSTDKLSLLENIDILKTIKSPDNTILLSSSLNNLLTSYDSYLQSYYDALSKEKSLFKTFSFKHQDYGYLYTSSNEILKTTKNLYEDFMIKLSKFKTK